MNQTDTLLLLGTAERAFTTKLAAGRPPAEAQAAAREVWNDWAKKRLAERKVLESSGEWKINRGSGGYAAAANAASKAWIESASLLFSNGSAPHVFPAGLSFSGWIFPWDAYFDEAVFKEEAIFSDAHFFGITHFVHVSFTQGATFADATFHHRAQFNRSDFTEDSEFLRTNFASVNFFECVFRRRATFVDCRCASDMDFTGVTFKGSGEFTKMTVNGYSRFPRVAFEGSASFGGCVFLRNVDFMTTRFDKFVTFDGATFREGGRFSAIETRSICIFSNATFDIAPDFSQATFSQPPRLDQARINTAFVESGSRWSWIFRALTMCFERRSDRRLQDLPARFRCLRRIASDTHDHERELEFFAAEVRSRRFLVDFPFSLRVWRPSAWRSSVNFWMGVLYGGVSNYGRAVLRPLIVWLILLGACAALYLSETSVAKPRLPTWHWSILAGAGLGDAARAYFELGRDALGGKLSCEKGGSDIYLPSSTYQGYKGEALTTSDLVKTHFSGLQPRIARETHSGREAFALAMANATVFGAADSSHRMYGCLYGIEKYEDTVVPVVPSGVARAAAIQKFFSAVLIFLFGLGLRNMLRLK